ncbi:STE3-domain-containing protein [Peniophora sp. CONT]|nr:STE3-domain-containing protein [Peniophora sp. CONT]
MAADPSYPLYPVLCIITAAFGLLALSTTFVRRSYNFGVAWLCLWLFVETLTNGINAIIWADNDDVKLYVYCDIVTHLQVVGSVVKPMSTLLITRRLYLIASLQSVELPSARARRADLLMNWTLGLVAPLLVAGPLYYIVQGVRFQVYEVFGCSSATVFSATTILLVRSWSIIPPLISVLIYYPKVFSTFHRHSRDVNRFLRTNNSVSRTNYFRILVLASVDVVLTLPKAIVSLVFEILVLRELKPRPNFYPGWHFIHTDWDPIGVSYHEMKINGKFNFVEIYWDQWSPLVLALVLFVLFGLTGEARASYWRIACFVGWWFGWKPSARDRRVAALDTIEFGAQAQVSEPALYADVGTPSSYVSSKTSAVGDREDKPV